MPTLPNDSDSVPSYYALLADADLPAGVATVRNLAGVDRPARRAVVGVIGAAGVTLTRPSGGTVVVSAAQLLALNGVVVRQFVAISSANSTDISVDY
jgi:hypothetical protein